MTDGVLVLLSLTLTLQTQQSVYIINVSALVTTGLLVDMSLQQ